jgi:hypothetical protein
LIGIVAPRRCRRRSKRAQRETLIALRKGWT